MSRRGGAEICAASRSYAADSELLTARHAASLPSHWDRRNILSALAGKMGCSRLRLERSSTSVLVCSFMPYEFIDFSSPELGAELKKHAKDDLPIDVWRHYVLHHGPRFRAGTLWSPASVIEWCDEPFRSTLDPQQAVDEAWNLLTGLLFTERPRPYDELVRGIWEAQVLLFGAHSRGRKRGQPKSMQALAVCAYIIRKFNPDLNKPDESTVSLRSLADTFFRVDGKCSRCHSDRRHKSDSACVKALITSINRLKTAMKRDGIPF